MQKLTEEEAAQAAELERQRKEEGGGASAWNHAGALARLLPGCKALAVLQQY